MSALDPIMPPELAVEREPMTDADLESYFDLEGTSPGDGTNDAPEADLAAASFVSRWRIEDDEAAEWAMRKLAIATEDVTRLREQADEWGIRIARWFEQASRQPAKTASFMEERLEDYGIRIRLADPKVKTIPLPSGKIKTTGSEACAEVEDDEAAAEFLETLHRFLAEQAAEDPDDPLAELVDPEAEERLHAWRQLLDEKGVELGDLVRRQAKVYVGPLRKLVTLGDYPTGQTQWTISLSCDHEQVVITDDGASEPAPPTLGEALTCLQCPSDPIEGAKVGTVVAVQSEALTATVVVGPDGQPVPGVTVKPASTTAKVVPGG